MRAILDTHTFLWWCTGDSRLSERARSIIEGEPDDVFLSVVSVWEIIIKATKGHLVLPSEPQTYVLDRMEKGDLLTMPIELRHVLYISHLPLHHRDPFDRMLVAQSMIEDLALVTSDAAIRQYDAQVIW